MCSSILKLFAVKSVMRGTGAGWRMDFSNPAYLLRCAQNLVDIEGN